MAINLNLYPEDVISNPGKPYVYFNSLSNEILDKVAGYFNQDIGSFTDARSGLSSVDQAFSFLQNVIASERAKEEAFVQYLKTRTEKALQLQIPSLESNWNDFVLELQNQLDFGNLGLKDLQNELQRLKKNQDNLKNQRVTKYGNIIAERDALSKTQEHLQKLMTSIETNKFANNSTATALLTTILEKYGPKLLKMENNKLIFNETELMAMLLAIATEVSKSYTSVNFNVKGQSISQKTLTEAIDATEIDADIERFIDNAQTMPWIRQNLVNAFGLGKYATNREIDANKFFSESDGVIKDTQSLTQEVQNIFTDFTFPSSAVKIVNVNNEMAEIESLIKFVVSGAIMGNNTGARGAKPDNVVGYITIDPKGLDKLGEKRKAVLAKIEEANQCINELINTTSQENTAEYYKQQYSNWNVAQARLDTILQEIQDIYGVLGSCFVLEDSTKNYLSLYTSSSHVSTHGGSLGANLTDQLNKIETLTIHGGISMIDKQWLIAAIINAGPNMIASGQKNKLENYLAMFAAILLFDSQINIAEEALMNSKLIQSGSTTHNIHLFSVNGGYYPLSYVLKLTYDSLNKGLQRITSEELSEGVHVDIGGFVAMPSKHYKGNNNKQQWDSLAATALKQTKIKMKFLVTLMNVIQNLLPE